MHYEQLAKFYLDMANLRIKEAIKAHGLSVEQVAKRMGILPSALSQSINGNPTVEKLEKIAAAIGCTPSELLANPTNTITCPHCGKLIKIEKGE